MAGQAPGDPGTTCSAFILMIIWRVRLAALNWPAG